MPKPSYQQGLQPYLGGALSDGAKTSTTTIFVSDMQRRNRSKTTTTKVWIAVTATFTLLTAWVSKNQGQKSNLASAYKW